MERRTASCVQEVLQLLPQPPRVGIEERDGAPRVVVREEGVYQEDDDDDPVRTALRLRGVVADDGDGEIYRGIFLFERPRSDALDAAWKAAPLLFHDRGLVATANEMIRLPPYTAGCTQDFTKTITSLLRRHPGPVSFFRVDSSVCPGPETLAEWVDLLSAKAVCRLTVLNISKAQDLEFPLHRLHGDGSLTFLSLGFFDISSALSLTLAENAAATFGALDTLILAECTLNGDALSSLISQNLLVLTTLKIWGSDLTAQCGGRMLKITAYRLRIVKLVRCSAVALTFESPALQLLFLGVSPAMTSNQTWVGVHLQRSDALGELNSLRLDCQRLSFETARYVILNRSKITSLPNMHNLDVGVDMCNADHFFRLVGLLHSMPHLSSLSITRTDTPNDEDGKPWTTEEAFSKCIAESLCSLLVIDYRGSAAELAFIKGVLHHGHRLTEATISPHPTLPLPRRKEDVLLLRSSPRASAACHVTVLQ